MPRSRAIGVNGSTPASLRSRAVKVTGSGAVASSPRSRAIGLTGSGATAVLVNPIADQLGLEPGVVFVLAASLQGGGVADSWSWRRVSGDPVGIIGTGSSVAVEAPANINGATVVIGVRATIGDTTSTERTLTVTALPQTEWWWTGTGWAARYDLYERPGGTPGVFNSFFGATF